MAAQTFRNRILSRMSPSEQAAIVPHLRQMALPLSTVLREPGSTDTQVYFLESGMSSSTALSSEGDSIEVGLAGSEGVVGIASILGHRGLPHHTVMQGGGHGHALPTEIARAEFLKGGPFAQAIHDFIQGQLVQASQCALCLRAHTLEPRLARWILTASDLMESETLHLTQEFLAQMIGAGRPFVALSAGALKRAGMIEYRRGVIQIIDRAMLEEAACECYALLRAEYEAIYGARRPAGRTS